MSKREQLLDIMEDAAKSETKAMLRARIAELEAENARWRQNMREAYEAFTAMRNDLNELFPIQSAEADLLTGPEWSVSCAAIVKAAMAPSQHP